MSPLASNITALFSWGTLVADIVIVVAAITLATKIFKRPEARLHRLSHKAAEHAFLIGFIISFASLVGSLLYSNVIGFDPCELCWWQRVFLYPQVILFAIAFYNEKVRNVQDDMVFLYSLALSIVGAAIAVFQYVGQMFAPGLLAACLATGVSCAKLYFVNFGYITIPMMSLTAYLFLILLYFFRKHRVSA